MASSLEQGGAILVASEDGVAWASYLKEQLERCTHYPVEIMSLSDSHVPKNHEKLKKALAALVLLTDEALKYLEGSPGICQQFLSGCVKQDGAITGLLFYLGISQATGEQSLSKVCSRLKEWDWKEYSHETDSTAQIDEVVELVCKVLDRSSTTDSYGTVLMKPKPKSEKEDSVDNGEQPVLPPREPKPRGKRKRDYSDLTCTLIPSTVRCEEESEVALCFNKKVNNDDVKVFLEEKEDEGTVMQELETQQANDMTLKFKTPEGRMGEFQVVVKLAENSEDKDEPGKFLCTAGLLFETNIGVLDGVNHLLLAFLDKFAEKLKEKQPPVRLRELDVELKTLIECEDLDVPPRAMEWLFGMYEFSVSENSRQELPTLLHFSAKYGLNELVSLLLDFPGAPLANSISNKNHKVPADLARDSNHLELYQVLQNFTDVENELYNAYVIMHGYEASEQTPAYIKKYYNAVRSRGLLVSPVIYSEKDDIYYITMNKHSDKPPVHPPRRKHQADDDGDVYDYTEVDPNAPAIVPRGVKPPAAAPPGTSAPVPTDPMSPFQRTPSEYRAEIDPNMPHAQKELIEIQHDVRTGELSINDAVALFYEWTLRNKSEMDGKSFSAKKSQLEATKQNFSVSMKPAVETTKLSVSTPNLSLPLDPAKSPVTPTKKKGLFSRLFSSNKKPKGKSENDSQQPASMDQLAPVDEVEALCTADIKSDRISTMSNSSVESSRSSRTSTSSHDSGRCSFKTSMDQVLEDPDLEAPPPVTRKKSTSRSDANRKSATQLFHERGLSQLPPKLPPKRRGESPAPNKAALPDPTDDAASTLSYSPATPSADSRYGESKASVTKTKPPKPPVKPKKLN